MAKIILRSRDFWGDGMMADSAYLKSILDFRKERDDRVRENPLSWLSLIGLFPLHDGENSFGQGTGCEIDLAGMLSGQNGAFRLVDGKVELAVNADCRITVNGEAVSSGVIHTDADGIPDLIEAGRYAMRVIRRGDSTFLRVWDREAPAWKDFTGYRYYPVKPDYSVTAEFVRFESPRVMTIQNVLGDMTDAVFPGEAHFTIGDRDCILIAEDADDELLFSFTDLTRGDDTYPGGRFISVPKPESDSFQLDFNLAVNWPCAYTSFATCPLPPFENRLQVRIEAGELRYKQGKAIQD